MIKSNGPRVDPYEKPVLILSALVTDVERYPGIYAISQQCGCNVHSSGSGNRVALECTLQTGVYTSSAQGKS